MSESKCDHIVGMHYFYDLLIEKSEAHNYDLEKNNIEVFNYCPKCGGKLTDDKLLNFCTEELKKEVDKARTK